jgi:hypothetical protein
MKTTDADLIKRLGGTRQVAEALTLDGQHLKQRLETVKKWSQNGIPWKWRGQVQKLAREKRKRVPADFLTERQAA